MIILTLVTTMLMVTLVTSKKGGRNGKCKLVEGLECNSWETLEPGSLYTIESKKCKNGKYPKNEYCYWGFEVKDCTPVVHCDYVDIKGRGKRCRGDILSMFTWDDSWSWDNWGVDVCGKKQDVTFSPEAVMQQGYLDIYFISNRRGQGKGFQCQVSCEETPGTTEESPAPTGETLPPTGETRPPTEETRPPTGETQPPTGETAPPTGETQPPTGETAPPTGETAPPTGETSGPVARCSCGVANRATRIVGGVVTEVNEYPWQVGLVDFSGRPYCGGSILSSKTILTAAHCTAGYDASSLTVVVAEHDWTASDGEQLFSVCGKIEHPSYDSVSTDYDFSILTLCTEITFQPDASPVCLPAQPGPAYDSSPAIVSGWGTMAAGGTQPTQLMEVSVQTMTNSECNNAYGGVITDSMICAAKPGKDACQGDSGGPLVSLESGTYYSQIGVVSWGYGCAEPDYPGVYARVTAVSSFITDNMRGSTCPPPTT